MNDSRIAYLNARLLDPASGLDAKGAVLVEDGRITDFGPGLFKGGAPSVSRVIDCKGMCLAPGFIDMRVLVPEPGEEHKETFDSASDAALAGGITTMVCLPNTSPVIDNVAGVQYVARRARDLKKAKAFCYGAITRNREGKELTELGLLNEAGAVAFTDGDLAVSNAKVMHRALSYSSAFDLLIVQHPAEPDMVGSGVMNKGEFSARLGLGGIPPEAEVMMIERDLRLVEMTGARYHIAHVSTKMAVDVIREAKRKGLKVTCDTAPHYFALNETSVGDYRTFAKVSPPLRDEFDRQAIVNAIADGTIDIIASDHVPHDQDSKRLPFALAEFGIIGMETLLQLTLELYHNGHISLLDAISKITQKPAHVLRLTGGRLKRGEPADLTIFDPDRPGTINEDEFRSKSDNSPYHGRPVQGRVLATIVDGRMLYKDEEF